MKNTARLTLILCLLSPIAAFSASEAQALRATHPEQAVDGAVLGKGMAVPLEAGLPTSLLRTAPEQTVFVADWPLAPGVFQEVALTRREIYAPDSRIYKVGPAGPVEVPRSRLVFFGGQSADQKASLWISIDPDSGEIAGSAEREGQAYDIRRAANGRYAVAKTDDFLPAAQKPLPFDCGEEQLRDIAGSSAPFFPPAVGKAVFDTKILSVLHTAIVAVDTDNELMQLKFSNNTVDATNYIAQLVASMSVIYERDLKVRLVQGTTFLRASSELDPYVQATSGSADSAKLSEFAAYWQGHYATVPRALAMMLSGKSPSTNGASGIGYINALCSTGSGYSFSQVFRSPSFPASSDTKLVAHELGHNFGSDHTHCYSPPIDNCYAGEAGRGCYSGTPACPAPTTVNGVAGVQGTLMSYCHISPGGCSSSAVFHQRTLDVINPLVSLRVGLCILPLSTGGSTGGRFYTVPPCRLIDTRNAAGARGGPALPANSSRSFPVTGACNIPSDAKAVSGNLTAITPSVAGFLNVYPTGSATSISLLSFRAGQIRANNMTLKLPTNGSGGLTFQNGSAAATNFLFDVNGYFR
jgi:hypothetical protein